MARNILEQNHSGAANRPDAYDPTLKLGSGLKFLLLKRRNSKIHVGTV